jgi:hypothetical protein
MNPLQRKLSGLLTALFLSSALAATSPESCLLFSLTSQNIARLGIVNTSKHNLNLSITNVAGELFFSKVVNSGQNYFQMLDLTKMPDGEYTVKLSGLDSPLEKKFMVASASARLIKSNEESESVPLFRLMDNETLTVSYFNSHKNTVNIRLEKDDEVIFEEKGLLDLALTKKYSLKKLPNGLYTFKLFSGDKIYSYPLVIK